MSRRFGIDTSIFVRLLTGDPVDQYARTVRDLERLIEAEPDSEIFVSNQVIGEAYIALQHHYGVSKIDAREAIGVLFESGLVAPLNGRRVLEILASRGGCGLLDRLIADDYNQKDIAVATLNHRMARLSGAFRLGSRPLR